MLKNSLILALLLWAAVASGGELQTLELNTGPYECGHKHVNVHEVLWTNPGPPIRIKSSTIWMGADRGSTGDMAANLYRASTGTLINTFGMDRYRNPDGIIQVTKDFGQDYVLLGTGEQLSLLYFCNMSPKESHGHVIATVWYVLE